MHIEINNYTGHESNCEINYYDIKGDYVYSLILEDLKTELYVNIQGRQSVRILESSCNYYDDFFKTGKVYTPKPHQIAKIEEEMSNCIDWDSWEQKQSTNVDDFFLNE